MSGLNIQIICAFFWHRREGYQVSTIPWRLHTDKQPSNSRQFNRNLFIFTIFRLIYNFRFVRKESCNGNYNSFYQRLQHGNGTPTEVCLRASLSWHRSECLDPARQGLLCAALCLGIHTLPIYIYTYLDIDTLAVGGTAVSRHAH